MLLSLFCLLCLPLMPPVFGLNLCDGKGRVRRAGSRAGYFCLHSAAEINSSIVCACDSMMLPRVFYYVAWCILKWKEEQINFFALHENMNIGKFIVWRG